MNKACFKRDTGLIFICFALTLLPILVISRARNGTTKPAFDTTPYYSEISPDGTAVASIEPSPFGSDEDRPCFPLIETDLVVRDFDAQNTKEIVRMRVKGTTSLNWSADSSVISAGPHLYDYHGGTIPTLETVGIGSQQQKRHISALREIPTSMKISGWEPNNWILPDSDFYLWQTDGFWRARRLSNNVSVSLARKGQQTLGLPDNFMATTESSPRPNQQSGKRNNKIPIQLATLYYKGKNLQTSAKLNLSLHDLRSGKRLWLRQLSYSTPIPELLWSDDGNKLAIVSSFRPKNTKDDFYSYKRIEILDGSSGKTISSWAQNSLSLICQAMFLSTTGNKSTLLLASNEKAGLAVEFFDVSSGRRIAKWTNASLNKLHIAPAVWATDATGTYWAFKTKENGLFRWKKFTRREIETKLTAISK